MQKTGRRHVMIIEEKKTAALAKGDAPAKRRASKEFRREQLINATIDMLAEKGFSATTLADVADSANLSRGIVNFHFESKENLLLQTLEYIAEKYSENWRLELEKVERKSVATKLYVLIESDLNQNVCTPRLISAWFGFYSEAQTRAAFRDLCWARDTDYLGTLRGFCEALKKSGDYTFDPSKTADAIYAMQEGLWLRLMLGSKTLNRASALEIALSTLGTLFPDHFNSNGKPRS